MNVLLCCFTKVSYIYIYRERERDTFSTRHENLKIAFASLADMEAVPEVLPPPAPGHHDSKQYPELDGQQVPSGVSAESPPVPRHDEWTEEDFNVKLKDDVDPDPPAQEKEDAAAKEADEGDWGGGDLDDDGDEDEVEPQAQEKEDAAAKEADEGDRGGGDLDDDGDEDEVEPQCSLMSTPACFGLEDNIARYLGMDVEKLSDFVPLLRVPFGQDDAMKKLAWSTLSDDELSGVSPESSDKKKYVEQLIADAQELRKQHENLVRRRMDFAAYCEPEKLSEMSLKALDDRLSKYYKKHRKDFEASAAQEACRKFDTETAGQFIYANIS